MNLMLSLKNPIVFALILLLFVTQQIRKIHEGKKLILASEGNIVSIFLCNKILFTAIL